MKKLTNTERASKAGKARWAKVSPKKRTEYARANGKKLWEKIKSGSLSANLTKA
jgi:hypothetical protein